MTARGLTELPICDTLLLAPAGCGKTDQLAQFAAGAIDRKLIRLPRQILGLTFSNKAKANLQARIRKHVGPTTAARLVSVTNFHGFAFRVYRSHANVIGADPEVLPPQRGWLLRLQRRVGDEHGLPPGVIGSAVRAAKLESPLEVDPLEVLIASRADAAVAYEQELRAEGRIDFDDLIRLGARVLSNPAVLRLYRERFSLVLIDEAQDLTRMQYQLVEGLTLGRSVFAGDKAQGIFRFAGAEPDWVFDRLQQRDPAIIELTQSHRSSPAVLRAVSALAVALGGVELKAAEPERWAGMGHVHVLRSADVSAEATAVCDLLRRWIAGHPGDSVGVIARTANRRKFIDQAIEEQGITAERWDYPIHSPLIVSLLRRHTPEVLAMRSDDQGRLQELYLRCLVDLADDDVDGQDELIEATELLETLLDETTLEHAIGNLRVVGDPEDPASPGIHLLNGHLGKGQQFTRVIVVGMEEAFIPNYPAIASGDSQEIRDELAVLHVMASRAQEDLVFTVAQQVPTTSGSLKTREPSRWLPLIEPFFSETPIL